MSRELVQPRAARMRQGAVALGVGAALLLAGCSAGQITQTDTQVAAVNGAAMTQGDIAVRDAQLAYPKDGDFYPQGADAPLIVTIVNTGDNPDKLVSVSSPDASGVRIEGSTELPGHFALRTPLTDPDDAARPGQPAGSPSPSPGAPSPSPAAGNRVSEPGRVEITITGLKYGLRSGQTLRLTFLFQNAGEITMDVPIAAPTAPRTRDAGHGGESSGGGGH
ncbi:hypothetical protein GCM10012275_14460 [Longimycelium tulufanense]|uniref:Copper chaperone PCu(A)C n=1 Tax=Longimycelium tulufanense TaxID=907463 RepID=A0A8J3CBU0_9PSEU|nr:hypothetical protein [Longimycelium tulufanense]GGM44547.1 hypothetical protein GCM10012275_14460 [Longimycelium tulufanense]